MIVGVGIDVVDIARFQATLERTPGLLERLFTPAERDLKISSLAARFAAKEAAAKALGAPGDLHWHDAEVSKVSVVGLGMRMHTGVATGVTAPAPPGCHPGPAGVPKHPRAAVVTVCRRRRPRRSARRTGRSARRGTRRRARRGAGRGVRAALSRAR